jgi:hypothetical protein
MTGHERIDRRSLAFHHAVAEKLRRDPSLLHIAIENIERWAQIPGLSQHYLNAWRELLALPFDELLTFIEADSEQMTAMRQATPFAGVLTPQERWRVYADFSKSGANR